ncbi:hypothetical protein GCM10010345_91340 [Streptomyces canarius]|uniref:Mutator family transposase n=1 Tax=Streptomyces canarius TaxID=285453 RepID=A0ABQ3DCP3_9ACTN|nr:hypothetical protein GCM10010345_91340 [Streptomyces canarius]
MKWTYDAKSPKKTDDREQLPAFYDFPAEHWIRLRTTHPIESTFAIVRLRTRVTRGAGSRTAVPGDGLQRVDSAQQRWQAVNAPHLVALDRAGARLNTAGSSSAPRRLRHDRGQPIPWGPT